VQCGLHRRRPESSRSSSTWGTLSAVRALTGLAVAVVLLVVPSTSLAQTTLRVGEAHGVRLVQGKHGLTFVFTDRAAGKWRRVAGKVIEEDCTDEPPPDDGPPRAHAFLGPHHPGEITIVSSGGVTMRAPRHGRRIRTGDLTPGLDYCRLWLARHTVRRHGRRVVKARRLIVSVPLTQLGAVFLDEESKARRLLLLTDLAGIVAERLKISGWPSYEQLADELDRIGLKLRLVGLAAPEDTPPAGMMGYYSDRSEHIAVVILSRAGKRLLIEANGDTLTTNLTRYLFNN
jgi:hypothetical protein